MKSKILHSISLLIILLFAIFNGTVFAQSSDILDIPLGGGFSATPGPAVFDAIFGEKEQLIEKIKKAPIGECHENLVQAYDLELTEFLIFLKTNFENKSANSTLVNIAIQRYSEYKIRLQDIFALLKADVIIAGDTNQYRRELESYGNCRKVMDDYISLAKTKMIEHIKNTSSQKKTTIMMEKYQAINERLADLNMEMAKLYANFVQFKNKLPFYNKNCVKS